jgi:hypothetical protein
MVDRDKYVDIFFRNGLKEFEVLPPPDVWDNIKPILRKRQKSLNFLRFAAVSTILISLSVFSYWLTNEISRDYNGPAISLNQDLIPEGSYIPKIHTVESPVVEIPFNNSGITAPAAINEKISPEIIYLKMSSVSLFTTTLEGNRLIKNTKPVITKSDIPGNISSRGFENLILTPVISESASPESLKNKWSVSAMASPNYFSNLGLGKNNPSSNLNSVEKPAVSYTGGMTFSYNVNNRFSVQSGVYYSSMGQKVTGINSFSGFSDYYDAKSGSQFSIKTSSGMIISTNNDIFLRDYVSSRVVTKYTIDYFDPGKADLTYLNNSVIQNFNYLEIPVLFRYKAIDKKLDLNFIGGVSYNMLVGNSAFSYVKGVKYSIGKTEGLSPVNFSSSIGFGFEYNLSEKTSLNLEPTFRYYLTPLGGFVGSSLHPYSFGIFSGLSYKF